MNSLPKVVFSQTLKAVNWANSKLVSGDAAQVVRRLKATNEKGLFVFGSGTLAAALFEDALLDEVRLALTPVVLGRSTALFGRSLSQQSMQLLKSRPLLNGGVILRYEPQRGR